MRILDQSDDKSLSRVTLYLLTSEAEELRDSLNSLLERSSHHEHTPSADYTKEVTVTLYDVNNLESFDDRSRRLIVGDA